MQEVTVGVGLIKTKVYKESTIDQGKGLQRPDAEGYGVALMS